jgi:cytochrome c-type biogenesis protein CcmH
MGYPILLVIVVLVIASLWWLGKMSRAALTLSTAALTLGMTGYAWQGQPGLNASFPRPKPNLSTSPSDPANRQNLMGRFGGNADTLAQADAYFRIGHPELAVAVIKLGLRKDDKNPQLWVGLASAMVAYGDGLLSPAAEYGFTHAIELAPNYPASYYFYGLALAQSGRMDEARAAWLAMMARIPKAAPQYKSMAKQLTDSGVFTAGEIAAAKAQIR